MKFDKFLKQKGFKVTPARLAILTILSQTRKPIDAQEIVGELRKKKIQSDPATVFRTLNSFADKNVVKQIQLMEGKVRYELSEVEEHHHFICKHCGEIQDISDCSISDLEKIIEQKKKVQVQYHALEFYGLCRNCLHLNQK